MSAGIKYKKIMALISKLFARKQGAFF